MTTSSTAKSTREARRSIWAWGNESDEPSDAERRAEAARLSALHGVEIEAKPLPTLQSIALRPSRIEVPAALADFCRQDDYYRASRTFGRSFVDRVRAVNGDYALPPDVVARPRDEDEVRAVLEWCSDAGQVVIPFGGGSSVVGGVNPPESAEAVVTLDMGEMGQVLSVDQTSRAARIQAGALGPALEAQLKPHGLTLRHFPQSFEHSSLGGWIATRSGGHYATNHTHIDEFVESVRMLTPAGVMESRRLPGSGAGPSPDRLVIGSEGILGVITEAWMRVQKRPTFRASAGVTFPSWESAYGGVLRVVQAKLWPANLRLLDPAEAQSAAGLDGRRALMIIGFESGEAPQGPFIEQALAIAREAGGQVDDEEILIDDGHGTPTGREGAVGAWRASFIGAPRRANLRTGLGMVGGHLRDVDHLGSLARVRRRGAREGRASLGGGRAGRSAELSLHARLPGRAGTVLHVLGGGTPGGGDRAVLRDQAGGVGRRNRCRWDGHASPRGRAGASSLVRPATAGPVRGGAAGREAAPGPQRGPESGRVNRPLARSG